MLVESYLLHIEPEWTFYDGGGNGIAFCRCLTNQKPRKFYIVEDRALLLFTVPQCFEAGMRILELALMENITVSCFRVLRYHTWSA